MIQFLRKTKLALLALLLNTVAYSQHPGDLDLTFNTNNAQFPCEIGASDVLKTILKLPNNQFLIAGYYTATAYNGLSIKGIAKINADGSADASFASIGTDAGTINALALQPDGKIIVAGSMTSYGGVPCKRIIRINANGTLDLSFSNANGVDNGSINAVAVSPSGKIVITGSFNSVNGVVTNRIARLNADGTTDTTFNVSGGINGNGYALAIQPDDKVVVAGAFTTYRSQANKYVTRINTNGTRDTSFIGNNSLNNTVWSLCLTTAGKLVLSGDFTAYDSTTCNGITLLNTDGSLDATFNPGTGLTGTAYSILEQADGKFVLAGAISAYNGVNLKKIVRINASGTMDSGFTYIPTTETTTTMYLYGIAQDSQGGVIAVGDFTTYNDTYRANIVKFSNAGTFDNNFNPAVGSSAVTRSLLLADGKILLATGKRYGMDNVGRLVRIFPNGQRDTSFNPAGVTSATGSIRWLAMQADGNIILAGDFTQFNGVGYNRIVRILPDGTIDPTFSVGTGFDAQVNKFKIQADGKIVAIGTFANYNGVARSKVARLNADGSLDTGFANVTSLTAITELEIQPDGKIIIGGIGYYKRLNADGTPDNTFPTSASLSSINFFSVNAINTLPDGKILIGGSFYSPSGSHNANLMRLNADGTYDGSFNSPFSSMLNGGQAVDAITRQPDGKLLIGGGFYDLNGINRTGFCRLNANGTVDTLFNVGSGITIPPQSSVYSVSNITLLPNDKILIGGLFVGYNGVRRDYLARIHGACDIPLPNAVAQTFCGSASVADLTVSGTGIKWYDVPAGGTELASNASLATGTYYVSQADSVCTSSRLAVPVIVNPNTAPAGDAIQVFQVNDFAEATIEDIIVSGNAIQWYVSLAAVAAHTPLAAGTVLSNGATYYATQTINGCESLPLAVTVSVSLGLMDFNSLRISCYPNPTPSTVTVKAGEVIESAELFNMIGQRIFHSRVDAMEKTFDLSNLPKALYTLKVTAGQRSNVVKISKN